MIINVAPQATIATTPDPSSPEEGTTLGVRSLLVTTLVRNSPPLREGVGEGLPLRLGLPYHPLELLHHPCVLFGDGHVGVVEQQGIVGLAQR